MNKDNQFPLVDKNNNTLSEFERASTLLAISSQLILNDERIRLKACLKNIDFKDATQFIEGTYPLSLELIERYKKHWNWDLISRNEDLPWSVNLIEKYEDKLDLRRLIISQSSNSKFSRTLLFEIIERYEHVRFWGRLSWHEKLPWSLKLIKRFKNKWSLDLLLRNRAIPWSPELIEMYKDKWIGVN